jgi:cyclophilin family peptidyl-prolyl cis-trans isomerase
MNGLEETVRSTDAETFTSRVRPAFVIMAAASLLAGVITLSGEEGRALAREEAAPPPAPAPATLEPTLDRLGRFYYAGDPVLIRVAVFNTGEAPHQNVQGLDLAHNISVVDNVRGVALKPRQGPPADPNREPRVFPPGAFFGLITDLRDSVEGLDTPGRYSIRLTVEGKTSEPMQIAVIPRFDTETAYRAEMDTDFGQMSFNLLGTEAPRHVQNFYNLANQGYYDGTFIFAVVKGIEFHGGDKTGNGRSSPGYSLAPEVSPDLKHVRGTLSMLRADAMDHGSLFIVSLGDNPRLDGRLSIFGKITAGEETLVAIENLPTSGTRESTSFRPLKPVVIRSIRVEPAPEEAVGS